MLLMIYVGPELRYPVDILESQMEASSHNKPTRHPL
jgi:hypothetical protein